jgi:hypothetical protein
MRDLTRRARSSASGEATTRRRDTCRAHSPRATRSWRRDSRRPRGRTSRPPEIVLGNVRDYTRARLAPDPTLVGDHCALSRPARGSRFIASRSRCIMCHALLPAIGRLGQYRAICDRRWRRGGSDRGLLQLRLGHATSRRARVSTCVRYWIGLIERRGMLGLSRPASPRCIAMVIRSDACDGGRRYGRRFGWESHALNSSGFRSSRRS